MKLYLISFMFSLVLTGVYVVVANASDDNRQNSILGEVAYYRGNYFEIAYPRGFSASPLVPMSSSNGFAIQTDEAHFSSKDGAVEFFVYSPLWGGKPKNYLKVSPREVLVSQESKEQIKSNKHRDKILTQWTTVKAKNGSYTRSFVHIKNQKSGASDAGLDRVFGIKYKNQAVYNKYRGAYAAFKKSLEQFSD